MIAGAGLKPACFLDCSSNPTPAGYQLAFEVLDDDVVVNDPRHGGTASGAGESPSAGSYRTAVMIIGNDEG